jgi:hypothetical protein
MPLLIPHPPLPLASPHVRLVPQHQQRHHVAAPPARAPNTCPVHAPPHAPLASPRAAARAARASRAARVPPVPRRHGPAAHGATQGARAVCSPLASDAACA